jgi:CheW-like domain
MPELATPVAAAAALDLRVVLGWPSAPALLALPRGTACEILLDTPLAHLPGAPSYVAGLIHRQGAVIPVFFMPDPWQTEALEDPRLVVLTRGRERLALRTDAQPDFGPAVVSNRKPAQALPAALRLRQQQWFQITDRERLAVEWDPFEWGRAIAA